MACNFEKTVKTVNPLVAANSGKFKWQGDPDLFQELVEDVLKVKGKWSVPRGGCKQIKTDNITIRFYGNGSILLEGPMIEEYRKILERLAMISSENEQNLGIGDAEYTPSNMPSLERNYFNKFMARTFVSPLDNSKLSMTQSVKLDDSQNYSTIIDEVYPCESTNIKRRQNCEESSLRDVSRRLDLLTNQFERHQSESSIVLNELVNLLETRGNLIGIDHLVRENTLLKQENKSLKEYLDGYKSTVADLNTKLKTAENDKGSLLTVIRLLNEDRSFIQPKANNQSNTKETSQVSQTSNPWRAAPSNSANVCSPPSQLPRLQNKYTALQVEDVEIPEINVDSVEKGGLESRQPVDGKLGSRKSAAATKSVRKKKTKKNTVIIGDSAIKYVKGWEISSATNRVTVKSFSGPSVEDMTDFIKPIIRKKPEQIILHIGTNNLRNDDAKTVADGITNLAQSIQEQCPLFRESS